MIAVLRSLYGREPLPFQNLNFSVGSEQKTHSDTIHFNSRPAGYMCGVWVALEDVDASNGPVMYYPGSQAWTELTLPDIDAFEPQQPRAGVLARAMDYLRVPVRNTDEDYARYERLVQSRVDAVVQCGEVKAEYSTILDVREWPPALIRAGAGLIPSGVS